MIIGSLRIELNIPASNSLKEKRMVLRSLKDKLKNRFNISVSEVDDLDKWQKAVLGIACVNNDTRFANEQLDKVLDYIEEGFPSLSIIDYRMEFL